MLMCLDDQCDTGALVSSTSDYYFRGNSPLSSIPDTYHPPLGLTVSIRASGAKFIAFLPPRALWNLSGSSEQKGKHLGILK